MEAFLLVLAKSTLTASLPVILLVLLSPLLKNRYSARGLYGAWILSLLAFWVPWQSQSAAPALTLAVPSPGAVSLTVPSPAALSTHEAMQTAAIAYDGAAVPAVQAGPLLTLGQVLFLVWALGFAVTLAIHLTRHLRFMRTVKRWSKPVLQAEYLDALKQAKAAQGIRRKVALVLCPPVDSPMLAGLFHPAILLPDMVFTQEEFKFVLAHELTHCKRRDLWVKVALLMTTAIHWFNPLVYLLGRSLSLYQEASCDAALLKNADLDTRRFYGETILAVIRRRVRPRTALSTSFYGGKNGMKQRIRSIMDIRGKKLGAAVMAAVLLTTLCFGAALAISYLPEQTALPFKTGTTAYVSCPDGKAGAPLVAGPSTGNINVPLAIYYAGAEVTVTGLYASSSLPAWNTDNEGNNWAGVTVGQTGGQEGISGYMPLYYLSSQKQNQLPTAQVAADAPTGYATLYSLDNDTSTALDAVKSGEQITLLGRVNKWYHVVYQGKTGFLKKENVLLDEVAQTALDAALGDRFDTYPREEMKRTAAFEQLVAQRQAELGGLDLINWPLADKAWFGQLEEAYYGAHEYYYMMPGQDDLPQEDAVRTAWETFSTLAGLKDETLSEYTMNLGFFTLPDVDPDARFWSVRFTKNNYSTCFEVILASPSGKVMENSDTTVYLQQTAEIAVRQTQQDAMARWESEKGPFAFWSAADKAAFSAQYLDGSLGVPDDKAISQEEAERIAKAELQTKYEATQEDLDSWKTGFAFSIADPGTPCWQVSFYDSHNNFKAAVFVAAYTGEVILSDDPYAEGNG